MADDAVAYLEGKGFKRKGREKWTAGQQSIFDCPLCGAVTKDDKRRFYVNEATSQFKTYCCDVVGNIWTLRRHFGDMSRPRLMAASGGVDPAARALGQRILATRGSSKAALELVREEHTLPEKGADLVFRDALAGDKDALDWLRVTRGFSDETVAAANLGLRDGKDGRKWISIPQYLPDKTLAGFKYRILPWHMRSESDQRFAREPGAPTVLYGAEKLGSATTVTLYEAELDALSGDQLGLPTGLSSTAGAKTWQPEWTALLAGVDTIFLAHDNDEDGDKGAEKVAGLLGWWRCRRVVLPLTDMNACLAAGLKDEVRDAFATAAPMKHPMVAKPSSYEESLVTLDVAKLRGSQTSLRMVNALLAGIRGSELTVVSGHTGHGKTTASSFLAWDLATLGLPAMIGSLEHPPEDESLKLVTMEAGESFVNLSEAKRRRVVAKLHRKPLYIMDMYGSVDIKALFDTIRYFYYACGGRLVVLDHVDHFIDRNSRKAHHEQIADVVIALEQALKTEWRGLHIVLVVHPKVESREKGKMPPVTKDALKGGGAVKTVPDNIWIVRKVKRSDGQWRSYWLFDKVRHILGEEGEVVLAFDRESLRFSEPPPAPPAGTPAARGLLAPVPTATPAPVTPAPAPLLDRQQMAAGEKEADYQ